MKEEILEYFNKVPAAEIFIESLNSVKNKSIWATSLLYDRSLYFNEIHNHKRELPIKNIPKKKDNKYENFFKDDILLGAYNYIANWDEPNQFIFIEIRDNKKFIYTYDIMKRLSRIDIGYYQNNLLSYMVTLTKSKEYNIDNFIYGDNNDLHEINSEYGYDILKNINIIIPNSKIRIERLLNSEIELYTDSIPTRGEILKYKGIDPYSLYPYLSPLKLR